MRTNIAPSIFFVAAAFVSSVSGHAAFFHDSMWGFNVTMQTFPYDNRPVAPLQGYTFDKWWFHNHLAYPPNPGAFFELPAGQTATAELACDKGATSWFASSPGGNIQDGDNPCPGSPTVRFHANNEADAKGCCLAITYESDVSKVQPEDLTVFSCNRNCVWNRFTDFPVPAKMPPCPDGGCICTFNWIHAYDSGGMQIFQNGFRCKVTGSTSNVPVGKPKLPRRCGADADQHHFEAQPRPSNCTWGPKQCLYWDQAERNNMFEGIYAAPFYNPLYGFFEGAQNDIFEDSVLPKWQGALNPDNEGTPNAANDAIPAMFGDTQHANLGNIPSGGSGNGLGANSGSGSGSGSSSSSSASSASSSSSSASSSGSSSSIDGSSSSDTSPSDTSSSNAQAEADNVSTVVATVTSEVPASTASTSSSSVPNGRGQKCKRGTKKRDIGVVKSALMAHKRKRSLFV